MTDMDLDTQSGTDADWRWPDPIRDGVWHEMPDEFDRVPCCDRTAASLPVGDGTTSDPARKTCPGAEVAS